MCTGRGRFTWELLLAAGLMSGCGLPAMALQDPEVAMAGRAAVVQPPSELPEAPAPQQSQGVAVTPAAGPQQTKRILGIIPNFRAVSTDQVLPAQTPHQKMTTALQDSFDYSAFVFVAVQAAAAMASDSTPEFRQGAAGYARYYWHTFADQADENLQVEGILPIVFHEDNRYYTKGHGNVAKRAAYSVTRALITRKDGGGETFNFSEIVGAGGSAAVSSLYYPTQERTWTKVGQRWLTNVLIDGGTFTFKEFWPDINDRVFHQKD